MNAVIYPVYFHRNFEDAGDEDGRSRAAAPSA